MHAGKNSKADHGNQKGKAQGMLGRDDWDGAIMEWRREYDERGSISAQLTL